jgi:predicted permease
MLRSLLHDVRDATRSLRRSPMFTITAVVTLALAIGANTAIFSLVNAVMLRTLTVQAPHELMFIGQRNPSDPDGGVLLLSNPGWLRRIRQETTIFSGVAAYNLRDFKVGSAQGVEQVVGQYATGNYHTLIGVPFAIGRGFTGQNDFTPGGSPIAVISDDYWRRRYDRSPAALGAQLIVGAHAVTVVGVTAPGFHGLQPGRSIDVTLPLSMRVRDEPDFVESLDSWTNMPIVARLKPGVQAAAAEPVVAAAHRSHMSTPGIGFGRARDGRLLLTGTVIPAARGADRLRREYDAPLGVLMAVVVIVLLIACVNVANLFFARARAREAEIGMRAALGAGRGRIVRHVLTEAGLIAVGGGAIGFVTAGVATRYVAAMLGESQRPIALDAQPDTRVLIFTLVVAGVSSLLFGLAPALTAGRLGPALRPGRTTPRGARGRMTVVAAQLALCVVLVFCAGLLGRTLRNLERVETRLATDEVVAFGIDGNDSAFPVSRMTAICRDVIDRLQQPGVVAGSCSTMTPLDTSREVRTLGLPPLPPGREGRDILANAVSLGYFAAFGIDLVRGRLFEASDGAAAPRVAILTESAARHFFGDTDPIGRHIGFGSRPDPAAAMTVVGIVRDVRQELRSAPAPMAYQPIEQMREPPDYVVGIIRTTGDAAPIGTRVRQVVSELSNALAVSWVRTLREQMNAALVAERLLATLSLSFAILALMLAAIGVYGVMAHDVARRTREIGIRMALGAQRRMVMATIFRQVAFIVVPGVAAGAAAGTLASAVVEGLLFGIESRDPSTLGATAVVLGAVACAAAYLPARRATRVDPATTLRAE